MDRQTVARLAFPSIITLLQMISRGVSRCPLPESKWFLITVISILVKPPAGLRHLLLALRGISKRPRIRLSSYIKRSGELERIENCRFWGLRRFGKGFSGMPVSLFQ
jgi:hypothetical protein